MQSISPALTSRASTYVKVRLTSLICFVIIRIDLLDNHKLIFSQTRACVLCTGAARQDLWSKPAQVWIFDNTIINVVYDCVALLENL